MEQGTRALALLLPERLLAAPSSPEPPVKGPPKVSVMLKGTAPLTWPSYNRSRATIGGVGAALVDSQRPPLSEASATLKAGKRLLPGVQKLVLSQVAPLGKAFGAKVTGIGPLA